MSLMTSLNLLGSLGLFLFGMKIMSDALMSVAGHQMRSLMVKLTANRFAGILTGMTITGLIQSSSATTLMVVSFVNAQLLSLTEAIGVIMGANIGTTFTAWLITIFGFKIKLDLIAIPLIFVGFVLYMMKAKRWHYLGKFIVGFALLFMGLELMQNSVPDLQQSKAVYEFFQSWTDRGFIGVFVFIGVGTLLTLVMQSSSATMAITLVAAAQGLINFEAAAAMVLGENIGTTIKAILAALVGSVDAKRTAAAHFLFNVIGVAWMLIVFSWFINFAAAVSSYFQGASPLQSALAIPLGLSIFHTCFNLTNTLVLVAFVPKMAKLVTRLIASKTEPLVALSAPKFLKSEFLLYPETAIHVLLRESRRLYRKTLFEAICHGLNLHREDIISPLSPKEVINKSAQKISIEIESYIGSRIIPIYTAIIDFASQIESHLELNDAQRKSVTKLKQIVRDSLHILHNVQQFRHEMTVYADSPNEAIKLQFDQLRMQMVILLRSYRHWHPEIPHDDPRQFLKALKQEAKKQDIELVASIDHLIRQQAITADMGVSLINCSSYILHISQSLINAVKILSNVAEEYNELDELLASKQNAT